MRNYLTALESLRQYPIAVDYYWGPVAIRHTVAAFAEGHDAMCADVASRSRSGPTDPSGWRLAGTGISDANSIRGGTIKVSCHWLWRRICRPARNRARVVPAYGFAVSRCHGIAEAYNSHVQVLTALTLHPLGCLPTPKDNTTRF